jgi:hypothetical protein
LRNAGGEVLDADEILVVSIPVVTFVVKQLELMMSKSN